MARFDISISGVELAKLKKWAQASLKAGSHLELLASLKLAKFRLENEPLEWGEPKFSLSSGVQMRMATTPMFNIWFGVDQVNRTVFVKMFSLRKEFTHLD